VLTGHPYLDGYYSDYLIENNRIHDLTILWAPHHNKVFYNNVSLVEQESVLRELIVKNENVRVIFRPHPNLFGALNSEMHMNSDDYNTLMTLDEAKRMKAFWENHDRVDCSYKGSIVEFFEAADLIITNCGGFQMEMLHSNRVLVNLINQKLLNRQLKNFQKYCYLPNDKVEFNTILNTYLTKRGKNRTHRDEINQYLPDEGKAGETIVEHICNFIN
jgi:UDP-N-acetylglucosamine 2-epimerase